MKPVPFTVVSALSNLEPEESGAILKLLGMYCSGQEVTQESIAALPSMSAIAIWILIEALMVDEEYFESIEG